MKNTATQEKILKSFMSNVNKLSVGRSTTDKYYGKVTLIKSADHSKAYNKYCNRTGYGTRKFSVARSMMIPNGCYTLGGLRSKLDSAIHG